MELLEHSRIINANLDRVLADPSLGFEYSGAIYDCYANHGIENVSEAERFLCSAFTMETCIQSSGLFSYFELAPQMSQYGVASMKFLGLAVMERMLSEALTQMGLDRHSTAEEISSRAAGFPGSKAFEDLLDAFDPLEEIYYQNETLVSDAIISYVRTHQSSLRRKLS